MWRIIYLPSGITKGKWDKELIQVLGNPKIAMAEQIAAATTWVDQVYDKILTGPFDKDEKYIRCIQMSKWVSAFLDEKGCSPKVSSRWARYVRKQVNRKIALC